MKAYLVFEIGGQYEDSYKFLKNAFFNKEKAEKIVNDFNNHQEKMKLSHDDWINWYDVLDELYPYDENDEDYEDWGDTPEKYLTLVKKHIPEASLKYSDQEIIDIYNYNMGTDTYDDPIYELEEIEIEE